MNRTIIKSIEQITDEELAQLNEASKKEFNVSLPPREDLYDRYFFLLKDNEKVLAMGQLLPVEPIIFNNEKFFVLGIGGIIAQEKGKGYGKEIMKAIRKFLVRKNKTGVGFCNLKNKGFYEKSGFLTNITSLGRMIYKPQDFRADKENECIFYQDSEDQFMQKVLKSDGEVSLPIRPVW